ASDVAGGLVARLASLAGRTSAPSRATPASLSRKARITAAPSRVPVDTPAAAPNHALGTKRPPFRVHVDTCEHRPPDASGGQGEGALDRLGGGAHAVGGPLDPRKLRRAAGDGQGADDRAGRVGDGDGGAGRAEGVLLAVVLEAARGDRKS